MEELEPRPNPRKHLKSSNMMNRPYRERRILPSRDDELIERFIANNPGYRQLERLGRNGNRPISQPFTENTEGWSRNIGKNIYKAEVLYRP